MPPHDIEAEVLTTVEVLLQAWIEPDAEAIDRFLVHVADDFTGLGTGRGDYYPNRAAVHALIQREREQMPYPSTLEIPWMKVRVLQPTLALVEGKFRSEIEAETETHVVEPRCSLVLERRDGRWLLVHFHFSFPDARQIEGGTLHLMPHQEPSLHDRLDPPGSILALVETRRQRARYPRLFGNPVMMAFLFLFTGAFGLMLALSFARTKSVAAPIGLHLGWNGVSYLVFSTGPLGAALLIPAQGSAPIEATGIAGLLLNVGWPLLLVILVSGYVVHGKPNDGTAVPSGVVNP